MQAFTPANTWEQRDGRVIRFRKHFSEKYTLTLTTDILAGNFPIQTKAQIRWALRVINVNNLGEAEIELITIENQLLEANNPNLQDIALLSQAFARMYSEIHVKLDRKGKILEVINLPLIISKWNQTKAEMQKIENEVPAIGDIVKLNDDIFASPDKVKLAIEHNEFFNVYFHLIYGEELPTDDLKRTHRNLFNSVDVNWRYSVQAALERTESDLIGNVSVTGKPIDDLNEAWIKEAYGNFDLNIHQLNPQLSETSKYRFQMETGKLLEAVVVKEETAHPDYIRGKMTYEFKSDGEGKNLSPTKIGNEPNEPIEPKPQEPPRKLFWERN